MQHNLDYITDAIGKVAQDAQLFQLRGNVLMQWNAQVADLKQGLLDIEANIMKLEQERNRKKNRPPASPGTKTRRPAASHKIRRTGQGRTTRGPQTTGTDRRPRTGRFPLSQNVLLTPIARYSGE